MPRIRFDTEEIRDILTKYLNNAYGFIDTAESETYFDVESDGESNVDDVGFVVVYKNKEEERV